MIAVITTPLETGLIKIQVVHNKKQIFGYESKNNKHCDSIVWGFMAGWKRAKEEGKTIAIKENLEGIEI